MATKAEENLDQKGQDRNQKERQAIGNAFAALEGQKNIQSFSAFTFEEALDAQIEAIEGASTAIRPNELERVDRIEQQTLQAITVLKTIPPEDFLDPDNTRDVNTEA